MVERRQLTAARGRALLRTYRDLHYLDRNGAVLRERLLRRFPAGDPIHAAAARAIGRMGSQKKRDGLAMLRAIRRELARVARVNAALARVRPPRLQRVFGG
jgi:hypothetical protein